MGKLIRYTALAAALGAPLALLEQSSIVNVEAKKKSKKSGDTKKSTSYKDGKTKGKPEEGVSLDERKRPEKSKETHKDRKKPAKKDKEEAAPASTTSSGAEVKTTKKYTGEFATLPYLDDDPQYKMPMTGLGMCCRPSAHGAAAQAGVVDYIEAGGRHIDTARIYQNHEDIGKALAQYKDIRSELFITTKLPSHDEGYNNTLRAVRESLKELQVDYLDLVLLHGPGPSDKKHEQPACVKYSTKKEDLKAFEENQKQLEVIKEFERAMRDARDAQDAKQAQPKEMEVSADGGVAAFGGAADEDDDDDMGGDDSGEDADMKMRFQEDALFIVRGSKSEELFLKVLKMLELDEKEYRYIPGVSTIYKAKHIPGTGADGEDGATLESTAFSYALETTNASSVWFTQGIAKIKQSEFSDEFVFNCENRLKDYRPCWAETWKALEELKAQGLVRSLGVSNFNVNHLQYFRSMAIDAGFEQVMPAVNQIEFGPRGFGDKHEATQEIHAFAKEEGVQLVGYGTMAGFGGKDKILGNKELQALAGAQKSGAGVTVGQLLLRWSIQHGVAVIPGSGDPSHMAENLDVFSFSLSEDAMRQIESIAGKNYYYYMFGL